MFVWKDAGLLQSAHKPTHRYIIYTITITIKTCIAHAYNTVFTLNTTRNLHSATCTCNSHYFFKAKSKIPVLTVSKKLQKLNMFVHYIG